MNRGRRAQALFREAWAGALSQPVASVLTFVMVAALCAAVILTSGRAAGAERQVLGTLDDAGTRTILFRLEPGSGVRPDVVTRMKVLADAGWIGAFGPGRPAANAEISEGSTVDVRTVWSSEDGALTPKQGEARGVFVSRAASDLLGLADGVGALRDREQVDEPVLGVIQSPDYLAFLEPLALEPNPVSADESEVSLVVVVARSPAAVADLAPNALALLGAEDPSAVSVSTSQSLADVRKAVSGQLRDFGAGLVGLIFGVTAVLVSAVLYGIVLMRRKDFGRRRALGAPRSLIIGLLLIQVAMTGGAGALVGSVGSGVVLAARDDPLPSGSFFLAVAILGTLIGLLAAVLPAVAASRRDPLRELRVP